MERIEIIVEPIVRLWYNTEQSKGAFGCRVASEDRSKVVLNKFNNITLIGYMPDLELHKQHEIFVVEKVDPKRGIQYEFCGMNVQKPSTTDEQRRYLEALLTPLQVENIFQVYELPVDEIINSTFDYDKVKGFGYVTYLSLQRKVLENFALFDLLVEFSKYGVKYRQIKMIYERFKNPEIAIQAIKENPYILYLDFRGISFRKADSIALNLGVPENSPLRIVAMTEYFLEQQEQNGSTYSTLKNIFLKVLENIKQLTYEQYLEYISASTHFKIFDNNIALTRTYTCELEIAENLMRLKNFPIDNIDFNVNQFIERQEAVQGFQYNDLQKQPFHNLLTDNVILLTGYAGTGKSTTLDGLCNMCDELGWDIWQFALAGKASDVMAQKTGRGASTIHRGLGFNPETGYKYCKENPMGYKVYILDEASMVNIFLFNDFLDAIPTGAKLIIVGDTGQLEAIGAGAVLQDMIKSNMFPTVQLTEVYRQALESGILEIATKIRNGEKFLSDNETGIRMFGKKEDCYVVCGNKNQTVKNIIRIYKSLLPKYPVQDIIILVPRKDILCGTKNLNNLIQEIVNPASPERIDFAVTNDVTFREGDKVINVTNNYNVTWYNKDMQEISGSDVYNGEVGFIHGIIEVEKNQYGTYVDFGKKIILYAYEDVETLDLAYALTVHKYQGSQSPCVIFGMDSTHQFQATRALVYTAWTRAESFFVACVDPKVLNYAIDNNPIIKKQTFLANLLTDIDTD